MLKRRQVYLAKRESLFDKAHEWEGAMLGQGYKEYVGYNRRLLSVLLSIRKIWSNKNAWSRFSSGLRLCLFPWWCQGTESNRRHQHFQCCALPTELPWHVISMRQTITSPYWSVNTFLVAFFSYVSRCVKLIHRLHKLKFPSVPI